MSCIGTKPCKTKSLVINDPAKNRGDGRKSRVRLPHPTKGFHLVEYIDKQSSRISLPAPPSPKVAPPACKACHKPKSECLCGVPPPPPPPSPATIKPCLKKCCRMAEHPKRKPKVRKKGKCTKCHLQSVVIPPTDPPSLTTYLKLQLVKGKSKYLRFLKRVKFVFSPESSSFKKIK